MTATVIIPNSIAIILLLIIMLSSNRTSHHLLLLDDKIFFLMLICNLIQCVVEIISFAIDGIMTPGFHTLILIVNSILFIVNILFAYLWVLYADYKIFEDIEHTKASGKKLIIPTVLILLTVIFNLFVPVFFRVTDDNHYQRESLFIIPYLVTYFYLAYGTIFIYKYRSHIKKYVFLPAVLFMLPIICGSVLQYLFYGLSTVWVGVAIGLVSLYINVQNEVYYVDMLSGIYTRHYMYQYLDTELRKKWTNKKTVGIMLDINEFKQINDTYGHLVGDDAIRSAGKILHDALSDRGIAIRYGGDEFVVLQQIQDEDDIKETLDKIVKEEEDFNMNNDTKYTLHFSKGYSILDKASDTVDSFIERMDKAMYEAKKSQKLNTSVNI